MSYFPKVSWPQGNRFRLQTHGSYQCTVSCVPPAAGIFSVEVERKREETVLGNCFAITRCTYSFLLKPPVTVLGTENSPSSTLLVDHESPGFQDASRVAGLFILSSSRLNPHTTYGKYFLPPYTLQLRLALLIDAPGTPCTYHRLVTALWKYLCVNLLSYNISYLCVWPCCSSVSLGLGRIPSICRCSTNVC